MTIVLIVLLMRFPGSDVAARGGDSAPLRILKERYARGEIGKDEFEQKKRDLESTVRYLGIEVDDALEISE